MSKTPPQPGILAADIALPPRKPRDSTQASSASDTSFGRLLLARFEGTSLDDPDVARMVTALRDGLIAGVVLGEENVRNFSQVRDLVRTFRQAAGRRSIIVAAEQPGGANTVLSETKGFRAYFSANLIANGQNPFQAQLMYRDMAEDLAGLGINMNIGPSADVCPHTGLIPSANCFGTAPGTVAAFANAFNFGHHDKGLLAALRHSPLLFSRGRSPDVSRASLAILHEIMKRQPSDAFVIGLPSEDEIELSSVLPPMTGEEPGELFRSSGFDGALVLDLAAKDGTSASPLRDIALGVEFGADLVILPKPRQQVENPIRMALDRLKAVSDSGRIAQERLRSAFRRSTELLKRLDGFTDRVRFASNRQP